MHRTAQLAVTSAPQDLAKLCDTWKAFQTLSGTLTLLDSPYFPPFAVALSDILPHYYTPHPPTPPRPGTSLDSTTASFSLHLHNAHLQDHQPFFHSILPCGSILTINGWSTTRKGRGVRPNYTRPGYFHCSSRPPQPARRPSFIAHYRPRRPGSGSDFDVEQYPMTWTPGPSVRKHASSRRAPRLVTAGPPAPPPSTLGGAGTHAPSLARTQGLGRDALALSLVNRSGPATTKGGGGIRHVPCSSPTSADSEQLPRMGACRQSSAVRASDLPGG